jgi:phosphatidylglycerophosphate synthase
VALLVNLLAAAFLWRGSSQPALFLAAPALLALAGLMDALDGIVARERGLASRFGDFVDHLADRFSDCFLVAGWALGASVRPEIALLATLGVALTGYAGTQIEATFGVRDYEGVGRGEFVLGLISLPLISYSLASAGILTIRFGVFTIPDYFALLLAAFTALGVSQRVRLARRLSTQEPRQDRPVR